MPEAIAVKPQRNQNKTISRAKHSEKTPSFKSVVWAIEEKEEPFEEPIENRKAAHQYPLSHETEPLVPREAVLSVADFKAEKAEGDVNDIDSPAELSGGEEASAPGLLRRLFGGLRQRGSGKKKRSKKSKKKSKKKGEAQALLSEESDEGVEMM